LTADLPALKECATEVAKAQAPMKNIGATAMAATPHAGIDRPISGNGLPCRWTESMDS
jgi:hypothetical protein